MNFGDFGSAAETTAEVVEDLRSCTHEDVITHMNPEAWRDHFEEPEGCETCGGDGEVALLRTVVECTRCGGTGRYHE